MLFLLISLIGKAQTSDSLIVSQMKTVGINFYPHNEVQLIMSGKDKFDLLFEDIRQAKSSVHLEYFNFRNDSIASLLFDILREKRKQGVEVQQPATEETSHQESACRQYRHPRVRPSAFSLGKPHLASRSS